MCLGLGCALIYFNKVEWLKTIINVLLIALLEDVHHVYKSIWNLFVGEVLVQHE